MGPSGSYLRDALNFTLLQDLEARGELDVGSLTEAKGTRLSLPPDEELAVRVQRHYMGVAAGYLSDRRRESWEREDCGDLNDALTAVH